MKSIRITDDCIYNGQHTPAGTIVRNMEPQDYADMLASGRAVIHRDPEPESRDEEVQPKSKPTKK